MFRELFKSYKSRTNNPDLNNVLFFNDSFSTTVPRKIPLDVGKETECSITKLGLIPSSEWKIYMLNEHEGLYVIKNPFTTSGELFWINKCLVDYTGAPNKCNLHLHNVLKPSENWWKVCQSDTERQKKLYKKLRWFTLGYHHDWNSKVYTELNKSEFPEELSRLGQCLALVCGGWQLDPQAAIINYYHMDSTLSGHTDHSEPNLEAPLISVSFGQSAIFLIGGKSLEDKTTPLVLKNGDVVIMSGSSRLCYHGVPRILKTPWPIDNEDPVINYLSDSRININMRQVLKPDQMSL